MRLLQAVCPSERRDSSFLSAPDSSANKAVFLHLWRVDKVAFYSYDDREKEQSRSKLLLLSLLAAVARLARMLTVILVM